MKQWFVVHTQSRRERIAEEHLLQQGFEVYLPRFNKLTRHARQTKVVSSPLFPRYLFVAMDVDSSRWRSINGTRGVLYILNNESEPTPVPDNLIEDLKKQENQDGFLNANSIVSFIKGNRVRILEGTLKDHVATFVSLTDKQRVQLLLSFLGREMKVSLPIGAVEAA